MAVYCCYFHGFASGPGSQKGALLQAALASRIDHFLAPDLNGADFSKLTMDTWFAAARASLSLIKPTDRLLLCGSSLGAYTAALLASDKDLNRQFPKQTQLFLLAPAFGFTQQWSSLLGGEDGINRWRRLGSIPFFHYQYQRELALSYAFYESCATLPVLAPSCAYGGTIMHGRRDEVLGTEHVTAYAAKNQHMTYQLVDDDHALLSEASQVFIAAEALRLLDACG